MDRNFIKLEYIEADGNQYIDSEYKGNLNTNIHIKATNSNYSGQLLGDITEPLAAISCNFANTSQTSRFGNKYASGIFLNYITQDVPFNVNINKNGIYIDENEVLSFNAIADFTTDKNLYLLTRNSSSGASTCWIGKLYYCKIYEGENLIKNFIPVLRKDDNEIGLYDLVNNKFYENKGTGNFTTNRKYLLEEINEFLRVNL